MASRAGSAIASKAAVPAQLPLFRLPASAANPSSVSIGRQPIVRPPALPTHLQVCECLILFMERNEEEFAKFLQTFTQDVWTQLMKVSQAPGQVRGNRRICGAPRVVKWGFVSNHHRKQVPPEPASC